MKKRLPGIFVTLFILATCISHSDTAAPPQFLGRALLGPANDVAVNGAIAHVATSSGLSIVDMGNPANPVERARLYIPDECFAVAATDQYVYLASGREGFFVVDVSNIAQPRIVFQLNARYAVDVVIIGTQGYFADINGLTIYDLSEPAFPFFMGAVDLSGTVCSIALGDNRAYVAAGDAGVHLVDVSQPMMPRLLATVDTPDEAVGIAVNGRTVYVADVTSLVVLDATNPAQPRLLSSFVFDGTTFDVSLNGDILYTVGSSSAGAPQLVTIDARTAARLRVTGRIDLAGEPFKLMVRQNQAYVAAQCGGLLVVDVADASSPKRLGAFTEPSCFTDVAASGSTVYVARLLKDVAILDVSHPNRPALLNVIAGSVQGLARSGSTLAVADLRGVAFYSLSNPASPALAGRYDLPETTPVYALAASATMVAIGTRESIILVNISNPLRPRLAGILDGFAFELAFDGNMLYAAQGTTGLRAIDISNPARPNVVGQFAGTDQVLGTTAIAVTPGRVFLGEHAIGVRLLSPPSPAGLTEIGRFESPSPVDLVAQGTRLYIADHIRGLEIVDVADPSRPVLIGSFDHSGLLSSLALEAGRVYLTDPLSGLFIVQP